MCSPCQRQGPGAVKYLGTQLTQGMKSSKGRGRKKGTPYGTWLRRVAVHVQAYIVCMCVGSNLLCFENYMIYKSPP